MTSEQAIRWLKDYRKYTSFEMPQYEEALDLAIQILQEEKVQTEADIEYALQYQRGYKDGFAQAKEVFGKQVKTDEKITDDDIATMRILYNADIECLCNQGRFNDAKEMEQIRDRHMARLQADGDYISRTELL